MRSVKKKLISALGVIAVAVGFGANHFVDASDHDDGVSDVKENNVNLTDLFVFREDNQTGNAADNDNLVMIMNSYGHVPPGEQVHFSANARYDFRITQVADANKNTTPTGQEDIILRFEFDEPNAQGRQPMRMTVIRDGSATQATAADGNGEVLTTTLADAQAGNARTNRLQVDGQEVAVFAGMRADPFFFDFEQFVKVRAGAAGQGPAASFLPPSEAVDFFRNENINSIVVRVPISLLQSGANEPIFDVWEIVSRDDL